MQPEISNESPSKEMPLKSLYTVTPLSKYLAMLLFILLPFIGGWIGYTYAPEKVVEVEKQVIAESKDASHEEVLDDQMIPSKLSAVPVLIYTKEVGNAAKDEYSRSWPIMEIWRKVGSNEPEFLTTVGGIDEFPIDFSMSPDKRYLSIGLESKIQVLNLETKELKTIFEPTNLSGGAGVFSPDSSKIAVVNADSYHSTSANHLGLGKRLPESELYVIDIQTGEAKLLRRESSLLYDRAVGWRKDGTIIVSVPVAKGCALPREWFYNPEVDELHEITSGFLLTSQSWERAAFETPSSNEPVYEIQDMCDDGIMIDYYTISDPITGEVFGKVGLPGQSAKIVALSPEGDKALLRDASNRYYVQVIGVGDAEYVDDYQAVLRDWRVNTLNAQWWGRTSEGKYGIWIDEKMLVESPQRLSVVAQYWQ